MLKVYGVIILVLLVGFSSFMVHNAFGAVATAVTIDSATVSGTTLTLTCTDSTYDAGETVAGRELKIDDTDNTFGSVVQTVGGPADVATIKCDGSNNNITLTTTTAGTYFLQLTITDSAAGTSVDNDNTFTITATATTTTTTRGGSACDGDCIPPTLGVDERGIRIVTNGFTYNGKPIDVKRYYTPYPLITVTTGVPNTATFKIYESGGVGNIAHLDFAFGLAKGQILQDSKARIEWNNNYGVETINLVDPENVLTDVSVTHKKVACNDYDATECMAVTIHHTFKAPLEFDIVATNVWDQNRNAWQNYYNHGIHISGDSLNPPKEFDGIFKGEIFHLTETGKNTAVDNYGNNWSLSYGVWSKDFVLNPKIVDGEWQVMKRTHSEFNALKDNQVKLAKIKLLEICPACGDEQFSEINDIYTIYMTGKHSKLQDPDISKQMNDESTRAQVTMKHMFDSIYPNKVFQ